MQKDPSKKDATIVLVSSILVVALVVVSVAYALVVSRMGQPDMTGSVGEGSNVRLSVPSTSALALVPDPTQRWWEYNPNAGEGEVPASYDDDGELHDGWNSEVSYRLQEGRFSESGVRSSTAYGCHVALDFSVSYPQLIDAGEHTDEVNEALRSSALSFVRQYWDEPSSEDVNMVKGVAELDTTGVPEGADLLLSDDVVWTVTYNTEDFISVSFSDSFCLGSNAGEYIRLRCVNANLRTGELYAFDDVLTMNEALANQFVDALVGNSGTDENGDGMVADEECYSVAIIGRSAWVDALMGRGSYARRVIPSFFVDEQGRVNMGVTYWLSNW